MLRKGSGPLQLRNHLCVHSWLPCQRRPHEVTLFLFFLWEGAASVIPFSFAALRRDFLKGWDLEMERECHEQCVITSVRWSWGSHRGLASGLAPTGGLLIFQIYSHLHSRSTTQGQDRRKGSVSAERRAGLPWPSSIQSGIITLFWRCHFTPQGGTEGRHLSPSSFSEDFGLLTLTEWRWSSCCELLVFFFFISVF